jgi:hypothetical protein
MATFAVGPFELMHSMHLGKSVLALTSLVVLGQVNTFFVSCRTTGVLLLCLGVTSAFGQVPTRDHLNTSVIYQYSRPIITGGVRAGPSACDE